MSSVVAVVAALGSASCGAAASALQHRSASDADRPARPTAGLLGFVRNQITHRLWWTALPCQAVGMVLHATALNNGALALVQPLLVCSVILALPVNHYLHRQPIVPRELVLAGFLVVGVAGFLSISAAGRPPTRPMVPDSTITIAVLVGCAAVTGCWLLARQARDIPATALLAVGAAISFVGQAAFLQATTAELARGPLAVLSSGALYGLIIAGTVSVLLAQLAFRTGPLAVSLPIMTVLNPLLGVAVGVLVEQETLRNSPIAITGEVLSLAVLCVAAIGLSRRQAHDADEPPDRPALQDAPKM